MNLALVINRSGGRFRRQAFEPMVAAIAAELRSAGHCVTVLATGRRELASTLSNLALGRAFDAVIVGGGDGTALTAIVAGLGRDMPLGVLPLGTLNLLARDLGLPRDPIEAARLLAHPRVAEIDLAEVNGLPFAIWASLGMHPWVVRRRDKLVLGGFPKWPAFLWATLRALRRYPMITVTLSVDGGATTVTTPLLVISNNAWRDGPPPLERAALDQGELVVHVARGSGRLALLRLAVAALVGHWRSGDLLDTYVADEVRVSSPKRRMMLSLDGEVTVLRSPLVFRVRPRTLRVLMPTASQPDPS